MSLAPATDNFSISMHGVGKTFANGVTALDRFNLDLWPGEFVSLLGPSGCGKSTALRMLAGLTEPTRGSVERTGRLKAANAGEIGFVFQEPTLMPWATVTKNVSLPLGLAGRRGPDDAERVATALAQVGLADFADAYPRELSGGMKMRVSIARALVTEPALLLMDEPFAALDEITRFKLNDDLLRLWRTQGWTVIFVTHSVYESVFLSQRVVVMSPRPGRISADLPIDLPQPRAAELRATPAYGAIAQAVSDRLAQAMAA